MKTETTAFTPEQNHLITALPRLAPLTRDARTGNDFGEPRSGEDKVSCYALCPSLLHVQHVGIITTLVLITYGDHLPVQEVMRDKYDRVSKE